MWKKIRKKRLMIRQGKGEIPINESGSVNPSCQASSTSCSVRNPFRFISQPSIDDTLGSKTHLDAFFSPSPPLALSAPSIDSGRRKTRNQISNTRKNFLFSPSPP